MIVVTGATGFIGRSVMRQLNGRGIAARPYIGRINDAAALRDQLADVENRDPSRGSRNAGSQTTAASSRRTRHGASCQSAQFRNVQRIILLSRLNANPNALFTVLRVKGRASNLSAKATSITPSFVAPQSSVTMTGSPT